MYLFVDDRGISHLNQSQQKHPTLYQNHAVIIAIDNIVPNTKSLKVIINLLYNSIINPIRFISQLNYIINSISIYY